MRQELNINLQPGPPSNLTNISTIPSTSLNYQVPFGNIPSYAIQPDTITDFLNNIPCTPSYIFYELNNRTQKELKEICKSMNLPNTGKKELLINRIIRKINLNPRPYNDVSYPIYEIFVNKSIILENILRISNCICNKEVTDKQLTVKCINCGIVQHTQCVGKNYLIIPYE